MIEPNNSNDLDLDLKRLTKTVDNSDVSNGKPAIDTVPKDAPKHVHYVDKVGIHYAATRHCSGLVENEKNGTKTIEVDGKTVEKIAAADLIKNNGNAAPGIAEPDTEAIIFGDGTTLTIVLNINKGFGTDHPTTSLKSAKPEKPVTIVIVGEGGITIVESSIEGKADAIEGESVIPITILNLGHETVDAKADGNLAGKKILHIPSDADKVYKTEVIPVPVNHIVENLPKPLEIKGAISISEVEYVIEPTNSNDLDLDLNRLSITILEGRVSNGKPSNRTVHKDHVKHVHIVNAFGTHKAIGIHCVGVSNKSVPLEEGSKTEVV